MRILGEVLLGVGLLFPLLSLVTAILSAWVSWRNGRHFSPVFIPLVGPILLTCWVFLHGKSLWLLLAVWGLDVGTLAFIAALPSLLDGYWKTSSFTRILTLRGSSGIQTVIITLHNTGCYLLKKSWHRGDGDLGIVELGETGTYITDGDDFELTSHFGVKRRLVRSHDGTYCVHETEDKLQTEANHSLQEWQLRTE